MGNVTDPIAVPIRSCVAFPEVSHAPIVPAHALGPAGGVAAVGPEGVEGEGDPHLVAADLNPHLVPLEHAGHHPSVLHVLEPQTGLRGPAEGGPFDHKVGARVSDLQGEGPSLSVENAGDHEGVLRSAGSRDARHAKKFRVAAHLQAPDHLPQAKPAPEDQPHGYAQANVCSLASFLAVHPRSPPFVSQLYSFSVAFGRDVGLLWNLRKEKFTPRRVRGRRRAGPAPRTASTHGGFCGRGRKGGGNPDSRRLLPRRRRKPSPKDACG